MNFFKSLFSADEQPPASPNHLSKVPGGTVAAPPTSPKAEQKSEEPKHPNLLLSLVSNLSQGSDVFKGGLAVPVGLHEPMTVLQRSAEMLAEVDILGKACDVEDPIDKLTRIAAFAVSGFVGTERTYTDFPSALGETYEFLDEDLGVKFVAEQVCVDPPISSTHTEHKGFTFYQNITVETSFMGNSIDLDTKGRSHIYFKDSEDHFMYTNPKIRINSLLFGSTWIEHYGELNISNLGTGDKCVITFKKSGFFESGTRYDIDGYITDAAGKKLIYLHGFWNKNLMAKWLVDTKTHKSGHSEELWRAKEDCLDGGKYNFTKFGARLCELDAQSTTAVLPPTDARLRPDRIALAKGDEELAMKYRHKIVTKELQETQDREKQKQVWQPNYFHQIPQENGELFYVYCGDYWEQRAEKVEQIAANVPLSRPLLAPANIQGKACDFVQITV